MEQLFIFRVVAHYLTILTIPRDIFLMTGDTGNNYWMLLPVDSF